MPTTPANAIVEPEDADRQLSEALLAGEPGAAATVRMWVRKSLARYRRLLANDADDLEQEVLLSLLQTLERGDFRFDSRLETYVNRIVNYRCIDRLRQGSKRQWVPLDGLELPTAGSEVLDQIDSRQSLVIALRVAAELPQNCRDLWQMIHDGLSYKEMAERTGVAAATLRVRVLRCRRKASELRTAAMSVRRGES